MSTIRIKCLSCGKKLKADAAWIGTELPCPNCKAKILIQKEEVKPQVQDNASEKTIGNKILGFIGICIAFYVSNMFWDAINSCLEDRAGMHFELSQEDLNRIRAEYEAARAENGTFSRAERNSYYIRGIHYNMRFKSRFTPLSDPPTKAEVDFQNGVVCDKRKDYPEAAKWYCKAADQGHAEAQISLADMYFKGQGVGKDDSAAIHWLRKAADQGYAEAQEKLRNLGY